MEGSSCGDGRAYDDAANGGVIDSYFVYKREDICCTWCKNRKKLKSTDMVQRKAAMVSNDEVDSENLTRDVSKDGPDENLQPPEEEDPARRPEEIREKRWEKLRIVDEKNREILNKSQQWQITEKSNEPRQNRRKLSRNGLSIRREFCSAKNSTLIDFILSEIYLRSVDITGSLKNENQKIQQRTRNPFKRAESTEKGSGGDSPLRRWKAFQRDQPGAGTRAPVGISSTARNQERNTEKRSVLGSFTQLINKIYVCSNTSFSSCRVVLCEFWISRKCWEITMGMMGMLKWLKKDRNRWNRSSEQNQNNAIKNNESSKKPLQSILSRRRNTSVKRSTVPSIDDLEKVSDSILRKEGDKTENSIKEEAVKIVDSIPVVPHVPASEIFEIGCIAGTEDRYLELMFAEWQYTKISIKRYTHPECRNAIVADLNILKEIRHPNVLLLMATTQTYDHDFVSIFEAVQYTLHHFLHAQGERIALQGIVNCGVKLADALRHAHSRGFIHSAISSHCIYFSTSGCIKIGGWELGICVENPIITEADYEMFEYRLRTEIYRWQAPEIFAGEKPCKLSDIYSFSLVIWEMCTRFEPWQGLMKADLKRQYLNKKCGVMVETYGFPELLTNLLNDGLKLDRASRTLNFNRMHKILQSLQLDYENKELKYLTASSINNDNNNITTKHFSSTIDKLKLSNKTVDVPKELSPSKHIIKSSTPKSASEKQNMTMKTDIIKMNKPAELIEIAKPKDTSEIELENINHRGERYLETNIDDIIFRQYKEASEVQNLEKDSKIDEKNLNSEKSPNDKQDLINQKDLSEEKNLCKKNKLQSELLENLVSSSHISDDPCNEEKDIEEVANISNIYKIEPPLSQSQICNSIENDAFESTQVSIRKLKEKLAARRSQFFIEDNTSPKQKINNLLIKPEVDDRNRDMSFANIRSRDYEPHKPASHKTSLEPKQNKSISQYNAPILLKKNSPIGTTKISNVSALSEYKDDSKKNDSSLSFFESSLWRKERLICISKMSKTSRFNSTPSSYKSDNESISKRVSSTSSLKSLKNIEPEDCNEEHKALNRLSEDDKENEASRNNCSIQELKNALDRATDIVVSTSPSLKNSSLKLKKINDNDVITECISKSQGTPNNNKFPIELSKESNCIEHDEKMSITDKSDKISQDKQNKLKSTSNLELFNQTIEEIICKSCKTKTISRPRRRYSLPSRPNALQVNNRSLNLQYKLNSEDSAITDFYFDDEFNGNLNINMILLSDELPNDDFFTQLN